MRAGSFFLPAFLLMTGSAWSMEIYCRRDSLLVHDGGDYQAHWYVVNSSVRRIQIPGQARPTTGCATSWRGLGAMYRPQEIIQAPKLGHVRVVNNYSISYQSAKNGEDALAVRIYWVGGSSGKLQSAIVRYSIHVSDRI